VARRKRLEPLLERPQHVSPDTFFFGSLVFSSDGATLAAGGGQGRLVVWDLRRRGTPPRSLRDVGDVGNDFVENVAFGPDGDTLLSTDHSGISTLWNLRRSGLQEPRTVHHGDVPLGFSEGGQRFVVGRLSIVEALRRGHGTPLVTDDLQSVAALTRDGSTLAAAGGSDAIDLWDVRGRTRYAELELSAQEAPITYLLFSPDGAVLASLDSNGTARLWDVRRDPPLAAVLGPTSPGSAITAVALSSDGRMVASGSHSGTVTLRETSTGRPAETLHAGPGGVQSIAFSPGGKVAVGAGYVGAVRIWPSGGGQSKTLRTGQDDAEVKAVVFSTDGTRLAVRKDAYVRAKADGVEKEEPSIQDFDVASRQPLGAARKVEVATCPTAALLTRPTRYPEDTYCAERVALSPDASTAAIYRTANGLVRLWNASRRQVLYELPAKPTALAFSPDGRTLAWGAGGRLTLWDVARRQPFGQTLAAGQRDIESLTFAPTGEGLATGGADGTVRVWDPLLLSTDYEPWRARLCAIAGRNLSRDEWRVLLPGQPYHETCSEPDGHG
jgi:WD40 repeat protein